MGGVTEHQNMTIAAELVLTQADLWEVVAQYAPDPHQRIVARKIIESLTERGQNNA